VPPGTLLIPIHDVPHTLQTHQALVVAINAGHRLSNEGDAEALVNFTLAPLPPWGAAAHRHGATFVRCIK